MNITATEFVHALLHAAVLANPDDSTSARFFHVETVIDSLSSAWPVETLRLALSVEKAHTLRAEREMIAGITELLRPTI